MIKNIILHELLNQDQYNLENILLAPTLQGQFLLYLILGTYFFFQINHIVKVLKCKTGQKW